MSATHLRRQIKKPAAARDFICGGWSIVTLQAGAQQYTYKVNRPKETNSKSNRVPFFVGLIRDPEDLTGYTYVGSIRKGEFFPGRKKPRRFDLSREAVPVTMFNAAWSKLQNGKMPPRIQIWHEGRCGYCGHTLKHTALMAEGFDTRCRRKHLERTAKGEMEDKKYVEGAHVDMTLPPPAKNLIDRPPQRISLRLRALPTESPCATPADADERLLGYAR